MCFAFPLYHSFSQCVKIEIGTSTFAQVDLRDVLVPARTRLLRFRVPSEGNQGRPLVTVSLPLQWEEEGSPLSSDRAASGGTT